MGSRGSLWWWIRARAPGSGAVVLPFTGCITSGGVLSLSGLSFFACEVMGPASQERDELRRS